MDELFCDACGTNLIDEKGETVIGISIDTAFGENESGKVMAMFGRLKFNICYCCWLKSLGVKPQELMEI